MEHRGRYSIFFDNLNGKEILWLPECIYVCIYVYRVYICITDAQMGRKSEKESVCVCVRVCVCIYIHMDLASGSDGKASACNAGGLGLSPGSGRSLEEEMTTQLQYSCLVNPTNRGAW